MKLREGCLRFKVGQKTFIEKEGSCSKGNLCGPCRGAWGSKGKRGGKHGVMRRGTVQKRCELELHQQKAAAAGEYRGGGRSFRLSPRNKRGGGVFEAGTDGAGKRRSKAGGLLERLAIWARKTYFRGIEIYVIGKSGRIGVAGGRKNGSELRKNLMNTKWEGLEDSHHKYSKDPGERKIFIPECKIL